MRQTASTDRRRAGACCVMHEITNSPSRLL